MSDEPGGPALRAVPGGPAVAAEAAVPDEMGLTPPERRAVSRSVAAVIAELGFASRERVDEAIANGKATGRTPEQVLLEEEVVSADQLARATAQRFGLVHVDLTRFKIDLAALNLLSSQAARRLNAAPIGFDDSGRLRVAISDPSNVIALDDLKLMSGHEVQPVVASPEDIQSLIGRMSRLDEAVAEAVEQGEAEVADVTEIRESADDAPVIKLVNSIIAQAVEELASDIHFEPDGRDMRVRFRVDGVLRETTHIPRRMVAGVVSRVKIMADLDIAEKRVPQDGRVSLTVDGHAIDTRIVTMPRVDGEGIVMRILDKSAALIGLDQLGMSESCAGMFEAGFRRAHGAVLATGPTGSGKSTTLYGALNEINEPERNIITIEDPVEYQLAGVNQLQVNLKAGLTFAERAAGDAARRPRRDHGRRDPRRRDGQDRHRVGADGPPRPVDPAHQRRALGDHAAHGDGHRALSDGLRGLHGGGAAARAPALHALQAPDQVERLVAGAGWVQRGVRSRRLRAGRLRPLRQLGLQGPDRALRGDGDLG